MRRLGAEAVEGLDGCVFGSQGCHRRLGAEAVEGVDGVGGGQRDEGVAGRHALQEGGRGG